MIEEFFFFAEERIEEFRQLPPAVRSAWWRIACHHYGAEIDELAKYDVDFTEYLDIFGAFARFESFKKKELSELWQEFQAMYLDLEEKKYGTYAI